MDGLLCPVCRAPLVTGERVWRCDVGHSFDVAREGYVNLLPVQHKRSREPGDEPGMVQARRAFLDAGHYQPLREALREVLRALRPERLLDVGCGEGYYTAAFEGLAPSVLGLDISRAAVRLAARRTRGVTWLVGTAAQLPLADASVDLLCQLFTPLHPPELARVLKPGGALILVTPSPDHLQALREQLFEQVEPHAPLKFRAGLDAAFEVAASSDLRFPLRLDQSALHHLLAMTPYAWRARPERRQAVAAMRSLQTEAAVTLTRFQRRVSRHEAGHAAD